MKKLVVLFTTLLFCASLATARPVDVKKAKLAGKNFVATSFTQYRQGSDLQLVYTGSSQRGEPCFYVFNVDDYGFVIVSADDRFRPITGYSYEGTFETENMSPELDFYLGKIIEARNSRNVVLYDDATAEWESLLNGGQPFSRNRGQEAFFICKTLWNQDSPYNYYAPEGGAMGPGGRCYAGCVATAMSQVMRVWCEPLHGTGSHSYYCSYGGMLSANFGATTYQWDHMPYTINGGSPQEDIEAIALLMYHCAISVNMGFSPTGSGAYSDDVPYAINHYFSYSNHAENLYRNNYSLNAWKNMLKEQFAYGWPVYYSGYSQTGGHAFVCDGYDDNDLFHYNWGWGGSNDGFFVIDEINYANWASAVVNFVPDHVYNYMPEEPTNLVVESLGDPDFSATMSWTNPSYDIHGQALGSLEEVVVCRDGKPVHRFFNANPGETMSFTDHYLPTSVVYSVYAVANQTKSILAVSEEVILGPTCPWTLEMSKEGYSSWKHAAIVITDGKGIELASFTPGSSSATMEVPIPMGPVSFAWKTPDESLGQIHFAIKNGNQEVVTSFDGLDSDMKKGIFFRTTNSCMNGAMLDAPTNLIAALRENDVQLHWNSNASGNCSFFIYRDGLLYDVTNESSYLDENPSGGFHSYYITAYNGVVESEPSNYCNVQPESELPWPRHLSYSIVNSNKLELRWDAPQGATPTAYMIYRRVRGGKFTIAKLSSGNSTTVSMSGLDCDLYDFAITAYYNETKSESAFGPSLADPSLNFVEVNRTIIPMRLGTDLNQDGVTLWWLPAMMADSYSIYRNGELLADGITEIGYLDDDIELNNDYCYTIVGKTPLLTSNSSNEACVNWATMDVDESAQEQQVAIYPNPVHNQLYVSCLGMKRLDVLNLLGQVVMTMDADADSTVLDLSTLKQGAYFIRVTSDGGSHTEKFLKM